MKTNKTTRTVIIVIGFVILVVSLLADTIGVGNNPGFGPKQTVGAVLGFILAGVGWYLNHKAKSQSDQSD